MSFTFQGIGTTFYGQRDFRTDGSFVTTEWAVIFGIPIVPLRSLRVVEGGSSSAFVGILYEKQSYAVLEKHWPNWKQVVYTYGYISLLVGWVVLVISIAHSLSSHALDTVSSVWLVFIACMIPVPTPWILRHYAQKKLRT
jgi:hypothetical protein